MKIVANCAWGSYRFPEALKEVIPYEERERTNPIFVEWVENHQEETDLGIFLIPDDATDWTIIDYDGVESVLAVVDGKIVYGKLA